MYIPTKLLTERYYVAVRKTKAFASWGTLEESIECIERFKELSPYEFNTIKGVIRVTPAGREWVESEDITRVLSPISS